MDYDEKIAGLESRIAELAVLQKAQEPGSTRADRLQEQINEVTNELLEAQDRRARYEQMRPQLEEARQACSEAHGRHSRAVAECEQQATQWLNMAKLGGVLGLVGVLAAMLPITPVWVGVLAAVSLLGAVGAVLMWVKARRDWDEPIEKASAAVRVTREYREALLTKLEAPIQPARVDMPDQWATGTITAQTAELAAEPFGAYPQ